MRHEEAEKNSEKTLFPDDLSSNVKPAAPILRYLERRCLRALPAFAGDSRTLHGATEAMQTWSKKEKKSPQNEVIIFSCVKLLHRPGTGGPELRDQQRGKSKQG
jgi:hypothetical protein